MQVRDVEVARSTEIASNEEMEISRDGALVGIMLGAVSGAIMGYLASGSIFDAAGIVVAAAISAYVGWWARGLFPT